MNWKTTLTGVGTLLTGVTALIHCVVTGDYSATSLGVAITGITTGFGLIFAKDHDVTGGTRKQD